MGGKAILIVTVGFGFILSYLSLNISGMSTRSIENMSNYTTTTESHNLAITGANVGLAKAYLDTSWVGSVTQTFDNGEGEGGGDGNMIGGFTVSMARLGAGVSRLRSVSSYPYSSAVTLHDTIEVFFTDKKQNSFSLFAWMTDFEGNVFWITGDTVWGRVHSNGNLHVNGSPVFYEKVTTAKNMDPKPGKGANKAVFKNGYETGVAKIDFPASLAELVAAAGSGGRAYLGNIWVDLHAGSSGNNDGYALVRNASGGPVIDSISINGGGFNGVILGTNQVTVKGTLDGQMTIASSNDVRIDNDVVYANRNVSTSDDVLGLVAESDVIVNDNLANRTNCVIDGSIFTRTGSFFAENYNSGSPRGTLNVLGSIVQKERGAVGTFAGNILKTGYSKRYRYDTRLSDINFRPPYYPGFWVKTYAITNWWESVRIPKYNY
jgi:hypothetical protein